MSVINVAAKKGAVAGRRYKALVLKGPCRGCDTNDYSNVCVCFFNVRPRAVWQVGFSVLVEAFNYYCL